MYGMALRQFHRPNYDGKIGLEGVKKVENMFSMIGCASFCLQEGCIYMEYESEYLKCTEDKSKLYFLFYYIKVSKFLIKNTYYK